MLSSSPALSTSCNVEFHITEINDNAPQFVKTVGEMVTLVSGSDGKIVSYTKIAYQLYIVRIVRL